IDALTALQVHERAGMTPAQITARFAARAPKAARARRRTPGFVRRRTMPDRQQVGGRQEAWTIGYLIDVILTPDPWLHPAALAAASCVPAAGTHGVRAATAPAQGAPRQAHPAPRPRPGPAGGPGPPAGGGPPTETDAVEFCRPLSGGAPADGLLAVQVPF